MYLLHHKADQSQLLFDILIFLSPHFSATLHAPATVRCSCEAPGQAQLDHSYEKRGGRPPGVGQTGEPGHDPGVWGPPGDGDTEETDAVCPSLLTHPHLGHIEKLATGQWEQLPPKLIANVYREPIT